MGLSTLPPELKLDIAEYLDPESSLQLALTCRDQHKLCISILSEYRRLLSEGQAIDTSDPKSAGTLLWSTLKEAARALEERYQNVDGGSEGSNQYSFYSRPDFNDLILVLEDRITDGCDDAIIAILIHHLPFLKTIRITDAETDCLQIMMRHVAAAYKNPTLQRLTTAAVARRDTEYTCDVEWACTFLSLPSIRTFAANMMGVSPELGGILRYVLEDGKRYSNATELFLIHCQFDVKGLEFVLAARVITAVAKAAGHSLEELKLAQDAFDAEMSAEDDRKAVSLREFKKLKSLNCEWEMLLPQDIESDNDRSFENGFPTVEFDVRVILPESLEELYLHGTFDDEEWEELSGILASPNAATPNLDKMCIRRLATEWPHDAVAIIGDLPAPSRSLHPLVRLFDGHGD
ncbi:uncharacterized protein K460DRAFT_410034 [Cucurbitaria berberidis CBS 394.84]|uniref:F-box domain-containing protein n=1 Tax=Cucurbitaria berberidis CBS 394.84 TaxID=1168544 RepID=A0A9P4GC49_9PLEO|nr:uncharacterized protein K460DRAFT_410034 [Cucurbitaria berberidis CBS 394.84]KAF1842636.1 hypothetical protein K460DRAFT_410034 [Cucurbitaria berberidis CBS 394.84]